MKNPFENRIFYCNSIKWFIKFSKIENLQQKISSFYQKQGFRLFFFYESSINYFNYSQACWIFFSFSLCAPLHSSPLKPFNYFFSSFFRALALEKATIVERFWTLFVPYKMKCKEEVGKLVRKMDIVHLYMCHYLYITLSLHLILSYPYHPLKNWFKISCLFGQH